MAYRSQVVLATRNRGKVKELSSLLPSDTKLLSLEDIGFMEEIEEPFFTFEENAIKKAIEVSKWASLPTIADDSGLVVPALGGAPGVHSARYAGDKVSSDMHIQKLLEEMKSIENREAYFVSVVAWVVEDQVKTYKGKCYGRIASQIQGSGGFGYDPVFIPDGYASTFGELDSSIKNSLSHRAEAIRKFLSDWD